MQARCGTAAPPAHSTGSSKGPDTSPSWTSPGNFHHSDHQLSFVIWLYHLDHHEFPWCGNYGGMSPTSAVLSDDRRHHDYPNHDYLDHDYPEHDYLDPRWCGNYGGLNPTSLSSFLVSVGHQVRSKLILIGWFSCAQLCLYWNSITADTSAPGQLSRGNRGCAGEGFMWHDQLYQV